MTNETKEAINQLDNELGNDLNFSLTLHEHYNSYMDMLLDKAFLKAYHDAPKFGFRAFLKHFSVGRNLKSTEAERANIIRLLFRGIHHSLTIDATAKEIQDNKLTLQRKTGNYDLPLSMVSKVFFLYRPDKFVPYDSYAFKALKSMKFKVEKNYDSYSKAFFAYQDMHKDELEMQLKNKKSYSDFADEYNLKNINDFNNHQFLLNRLTDKMLWVKGKPTKK